MRGSSLSYFSLAVFAAALVMTCIAAFLFYYVSTGLTAHQSLVAKAQAENDSQASTEHIHQLATDSATERAQLDSALNVDVIAIANAIESAGKAAGATTVIGAASSQAISAGGSNLHALVFSVQSTGSFQEVMRAAQLFQTLPLASNVEELDFQQVSASTKGNTWQLSARIRVVTSANISS